MPHESLRKLVPVPLTHVKLNDAFWAPRIQTNRNVTLPIEYEQCRKTGRIDAWKLDWKPGDPNPPHVFWDSDVAKWIEAAAYSLAAFPDAELEASVDGVIDMIAAAQQDDGYLNVHFTVVEPEKRWANLRDQHELYCAGHLMEAAVAYHDATGKRAFLDVMCRYADCIDATFGSAEGKKRGYPGHEEIELALVKLYRATGKQQYLDLATFFVNERGQEPHYFVEEATARGEDGEARRGSLDYHQAHLPVREQTTAEGHSVRACYLYAGMADVAAETGDEKLLKACKRIWRNIAERRMYIHGGVGSSRFGERFTFDYDLPNEGAYAETCAAIALVFFAHRMLQIEAHGRYADVMERALYNGTISGISLDGAHFFYDNYLASHPLRHRFSNQKSPERQEWFGCACCPPNIARLLSSLPEYVYSQSADGVWVHLYANGQAAVNLGDMTLQIDQKTKYPWKGKVRLTLTPDQPATFSLALRIPGWCRSFRIKVNGEKTAVRSEKGYVQLRRHWSPGDTVQLSLDMPVERIEAHPSVRHDCGRIALQRGPIVYCLEEADNGAGLNDIALPRDARLKTHVEPELLGGVVTISAKARRRRSEGWQNRLYSADASELVKTRIKAIPYAAWANRGPGEMIVWIRQA